MTTSFTSDDFVNHSLNAFNQKLTEKMGANVLALKAPMQDGIDIAVRQEVEELKEREKTDGSNNEKLAVLLETEGGSIEVVERIVTVLRHHYKHVSFVIPNYAYSAGTVLVLSGDEIYMDYFSVLGPIDPQVRNREGKWIPGTGYLHKYEELIKKDKNSGLTPAEINFLVNRFDPAELFFIEQAIEHSKTLITQWLPIYKFKAWDKKRSTGKKVTLQSKKARARKIASILGNSKRWNSHGRGITIRDLEGDDIDLRINNFGNDPDLSESITQYFDLFTDYCYKQGAQYAIHGSSFLKRLG